MSRHPIVLLVSFSLLTTLGARAADDVVRLSEPVAATATHETFGAPMPGDGEATTLSQIFDDIDAHLDKDVVVTTRIAKVCQKKGCFFIAAEGPYSARVTFKDYAFFIPSDSGGKSVELAGRFDRQTLSPKKAAHYAADLGEKTTPAAADHEYVIVATSVRIPRQ